MIPTGDIDVFDAQVFNLRTETVNFAEQAEIIIAFARGINGQIYDDMVVAIKDAFKRCAIKIPGFIGIIRIRRNHSGGIYPARQIGIAGELRIDAVGSVRSRIIRIGEHIKIRQVFYQVRS